MRLPLRKGAWSISTPQASAGNRGKWGTQYVCCRWSEGEADISLSLFYFALEITVRGGPGGGGSTAVLPRRRLVRERTLPTPTPTRSEANMRWPAVRPGRTLMVAHGSQRHGGNTAALGAVRLAPKLTRPYAGFEIRGEGHRGAGEDTLLRRLGRMTKLFNHLPVHLELGIKRKETLQLVKQPTAHGGRNKFRALGTLLRGEKADPDSLYFRTGAPEA